MGGANKKLAALSAVVAVLPAIGVAVFIYQQNLAKERLRRNLYVADMNVAQQALAENNAGHALELISRYVPKAKEEDLRGFEWRYFWSRAQGDHALVLRGHSNMVADVSFSPDGRYLGSVDIDVVVKLWDRSDQSVTNLFQFSGRGLSTSFCRMGATSPRVVGVKRGIWDRHRGQWTRVRKFVYRPCRLFPVGPVVALSSERYFWFGSGWRSGLVGLFRQPQQRPAPAKLGRSGRIFRRWAAARLGVGDRKKSISGTPPRASI